MEHFLLTSIRKSNGRLTFQALYTYIHTYHTTFPEKGDIYSEILTVDLERSALPTRKPLQSSSLSCDV
jgi:hypothetical protein